MTAELSNPQVRADAPGYEVPADIAWIDGSGHGREGDLYLTKVPGGNTVLLRGSSRLIWLAAIESPEVVAAVADAAGVAAADIAEEVTAFLAELTTKGLLTRR